VSGLGLGPRTVRRNGGGGCVLSIAIATDLSYIWGIASICTCVQLIFMNAAQAGSGDCAGPLRSSRALYNPDGNLSSTNNALLKPGRMSRLPPHPTRDPAGPILGLGRDPADNNSPQKQLPKMKNLLIPLVEEGTACKTTPKSHVLV